MHYCLVFCNALCDPLDQDVLFLESFKGNECISVLFHFELTLLLERHDIRAQEDNPGLIIWTSPLLQDI